MPILVIPEALQRFSEGQTSYQLTINNLNNFKKALEQELPQLAEVVFEEDSLHPFVRVAMNGQLVETIDTSFPVSEQDEIEFLVAVSGG